MKKQTRNLVLAIVAALGLGVARDLLDAIYDGREIWHPARHTGAQLAKVVQDAAAPAAAHKVNPLARVDAFGAKAR